METKDYSTQKEVQYFSEDYVPKGELTKLERKQLHEAIESGIDCVMDADECLNWMKSQLNENQNEKD